MSKRKGALALLIPLIPHEPTAVSAAYSDPMANVPASLDPIAFADLAAGVRLPSQAELFSPLAGQPCVVVELDAEHSPDAPDVEANCPVVAITRRDDVPALVDVAVATRAEAAEVVAAIARNPLAATVLTRLLRHNERASVADALFAESLAYSTLQHGAEFRAWLANRTQRPAKPEPDQEVVLLERADQQLRVVLNRPHKRNAYSAQLRDALCEALALAVEDDTISEVRLEGAGACFSAGGDLDEFGAARDAAVAHVSRTTRSAATLIHRLRARVEARLHGACIGAGIELPAFAGRVVAREDAFFQLPEVGMGLVPGAGGTASILPRIGRRRLAYMAITGKRIDAATALEWGLVDAVEAWR